MRKVRPGEIHKIPPTETDKRAYAKAHGWCVRCLRDNDSTTSVTCLHCGGLHNKALRERRRPGCVQRDVRPGVVHQIPKTEPNKYLYAKLHGWCTWCHRDNDNENSFMCLYCAKMKSRLSRAAWHKKHPGSTGGWTRYRQASVPHGPGEEVLVGDRGSGDPVGVRASLVEAGA